MKHNLRSTGLAVLLLLGGLIAWAAGRSPSSRSPSPASNPSTMNPLPETNSPAALVSSNPATTVATSAASETAILAGGCFWGMEEILRKIPGVTRTTVGYTGGTTSRPTYAEVCRGQDGHAEAIEILFDPTQLSYEALLGYFFRMHDPTTLNRQHNDIGTQYRSAIFFTNPAQQQTATQVKARLDAAGKFKRPITTEITAASTFHPAEEYHQKYLIKNPGGYNCHVLRD